MISLSKRPTTLLFISLAKLIFLVKYTQSRDGEMVDTIGLGPIARNGVEVRVLFPAQLAFNLIDFLT